MCQCPLDTFLEGVLKQDLNMGI